MRKTKRTLVDSIVECKVENGKTILRSFFLLLSTINQASNKNSFFTRNKLHLWTMSSVSVKEAERRGKLAEKRGELCVCKWRSLMEATRGGCALGWFRRVFARVTDHIDCPSQLMKKSSDFQRSSHSLIVARWWSASRPRTDSSSDERLACNYIEKSRVSPSLTPRLFRIEGVRACKWKA